MNIISSNKLILEKHDAVLSTKTKFLFNQIIGVSYLKLEKRKKRQNILLELLNTNHLISKHTFD